MKWIKKLLKKPTKKSNAEIVADRFNSNMAEIRKAGSFEGRHYTECSGQLIPDTGLDRYSAFAGGHPSLN